MNLKTIVVTGAAQGVGLARPRCWHNVIAG
jgi:hypothetical protein